jgi:integrase
MPPPNAVYERWEWPLLEFYEQIYLIENTELAGGSSRSDDDHRLQIANFQRWLDEQPPPRRPALLSDLTDTNVAAAMRWQLGRSPTKSRATANKLRRTLVAIHNWALDRKDFPGKKLKVEPFKEPKRLPQAWSIDVLGQIVTAGTKLRGTIGPLGQPGVPAHRWAPAMLLGIYNTGLRISAWMNTPTAGLDLAAGTLLVPAEVQKQDADQLIWLLPVVREALAAIEPHRNARMGDDWPHDRSQRGWRALNHLLKKLLVSAGIYSSVAQVPSRDLFHKFRRTHGSYIANAAGEDAARQSLGHSHASVTRRYVDPSLVAGVRQSELLPSPRVTLPLRIIRAD